MSIAGQCSSSFPISIRKRGESYFKDNRVDIFDIQKNSIDAFVAGSDEYEVQLALKKVSKRFQVSASCTCPHFDEGNLCKHIFAVILAAEKKGWAKHVTAGKTDLSVQWDGEFTNDQDDDRWDEDEDEDPVDDGIPGDYVTNRQKPPQKAQHSYSRGQTSLDWKNLFNDMNRIGARRSSEGLKARITPPSDKMRELWYGVSLAASKAQGELTLDLFQREKLKTGVWGAFKNHKVHRSDLESLNSSTDRAIIELMLGGEAASEFPNRESNFIGYSAKSGRYKVSAELARVLLPRLSATGRLSLIDFADESPSVEQLVYETEVWEFELALNPAVPEREGWLLQGQLRRDDSTVALSEPRLLLQNGLVIFDQTIAPLARMSPEDFQWIVHLRLNEQVRIPARDFDSFVEESAHLPCFPKINWPAATGWKYATGMPEPKLSITVSSENCPIGQLMAFVVYDYEGRRFRQHDVKAIWVDRPGKVVWRRNPERELELFNEILMQKGVMASGMDDADVCFPITELESLTTFLSENGWLVEAEGRPLRKSGEFKLFVSSGVDWFDLQANFQFGAESADLPALLKALEQGQKFVRLGDGSMGILPAEWLENFRPLTRFGQLKKNGVRFRRMQVTILDSLLDDLPEATVDQHFADLRARIKSFAGIKPSNPGTSFRGSLREYQREGLGWLNFLQDFGFGGCLADDMGLGKTVQVLAMLQGRYAAKKISRPSLVVVPRSLVHNWMAEAQRFCPDLRIYDYSHHKRHENWSAMASFDIVLTTYGVLRRDINELRSITFDYAILDEAQAIKNQSAHVAKAARLIKAEHRLAMSGTPVENHLGELGSIFDFLNPGMLKSSMLAAISKKGHEAGSDIALLARVLKPFILRRTKQQVLRDLPDKTEQTVVCELKSKQRKLYDELRRHYQWQLTATIKEKGISASRIHVLEALLRLRQAACHPGLIDKDRRHESSAKLDALLEQLREVADGGHKALVFSQFTSMLSLVRERLDKESIKYEYLDGKTKDRQMRVQKFQTDTAIPIFLISLKAGGLGLNLTAADYCFILDPWWNPAVEAQAIDRAHRMGQTKSVFAYRLIARDTVEEKILALQERKRDLANAIVSAENSVLKSLTLEDIQLLLS
ncbi:MAG TPA: SNF2-related protein [Oligoflexus sp.]|uniref:DEAD/DEAH box helicase n=1 Tax=Oligoflexus sp. TaxID=1971216 RepID=UPI002D5D641C|nr:SNF2-related protein [Oligoflexus sp.]HYX37999.1 SNF2-related protein [Oligoflexus sp.]